MDPLHVANEGKAVAFVGRDDADAVLDAMRHHPEGANATVIGRVVDDHHGMVISKTALGAHRVIDTHVGEQLPRIC
jgi:hydrogenase expression/formation protein HypE